MQTDPSPIEPQSNSKIINPQEILLDDEVVNLNDFINKFKKLNKKTKKIKTDKRKIARKFREEEELKPYQAELIQLQSYLEKNNRRMIILFEGRDAAGKGGTIRRVTRFMNEKHYRVVALPKPTTEQKTQWYYQKYISHFPHGGEIVIFDRSWYNRAMVERVFGFCTNKEYKDFMRGVVGFERDIIRQDTILVKLYFSVVKEEQARRFENRRTNPLKQWKLSEVDLQAQDRWDEFTNVKYEMLKRTHTINSPWTVIRSNNKFLARLNAMKVILNNVPYEKLNKNLDFTLDDNIVISGSRELEILASERIQNDTQ